MISVSFLKSKLSKEETLQKIEESKANFIHVDLMDGIYVPEKNFEIDDIVNTLKNTNKLLDIHLMTKDPLQYIKKLVDLNVWMITIHLDSTDNPLKVINFIKSNHIKVGVAINPKDDIISIANYLDIIDYVLVMSVTPGAGGQKFILKSIDKINYLQDKHILIGVDGGINDESIKYLKDYRVDVIVSGSFICMSSNYNKSIDKLKS